MMKIKFILFTGFVLLCSVKGHSATNVTQEKLNVVKKVYAEKLNAESDEDVLRRYSSNDFRQILRQLEAISDRYEDEQCLWQGESVIIPGQDYDLQAHKIRYSVLQNGRIRAQAKNLGKNFTVDFNVQCHNHSCHISDVYIPHSFKNELAAYARKGKC